ncbi:hypothetical protein B296_00023915, partial [Ensete ventricosum]
MGKEGSVITKPPPMKKAFSGRYHGVKGELLGLGAAKVAACGKRQALFCNHLRMALFVFGLMGSFFVLDSLMLVVIHHFNFRRGSALRKSSGLQVCVSLVPGPSSISKEVAENTAWMQGGSGNGTEPLHGFSFCRFLNDGGLKAANGKNLNELRAKVSNFDLYRPIQAVCTDPYADRLLPGGTAKIDRQWSISIIGDRLREKSTADGRLREKKGRRRRRRRGKKKTSFPHAVLTRASSSPTGNSSPFCLLVRGERLRRHR